MQDFLHFENEGKMIMHDNVAYHRLIKTAETNPSWYASALMLWRSFGIISSNPTPFFLYLHFNKTGFGHQHLEKSKISWFGKQFTLVMWENSDDFPMSVKSSSWLVYNVKMNKECQISTRDSFLRSFDCIEFSDIFCYVTSFLFNN